MTSSLRILVIASELALVAAATPRPDALLGALAKDAERFWDQFSALQCTEVVLQQKLEPGGKTILERKSSFDYLILLQLAGDDLMVEESRLLQGKAHKDSDRALLATNGFSTLLLIFHPLFQQSFDFEDMGTVEWSGKSYRQIRFEHVPGRRSPSVLQLRQRDYPVAWKGLAWVEPETNSVARIQVELKAPMEDVGLTKLTSEVQYMPVRISGDPAARRMPHSAVVEAATRKQRWRNTHTFSRYRQFQVTTDYKTEAPVERPDKDKGKDR